MKEISYSLKDNFIKSVGRFKDRIAIENRLSSKEEEISYKELGEKVEKLAFFLHSLGLKKGDRVGIILENRPQWCITFFALSYLGLVAVPLDSRLPQKNIESVFSESKPKCIFISKENQASCGFIGEIDGVEKIIVVDLEKEDGKFIPFPTDVVVPKNFNTTEITPDELALILYTSGTTDVPKGVMLTNKNLCSNFNSLDKIKLFSHKDIILSLLPLYHSYPLMATLITPIFKGSKIVYVPSDWPEKLVEYLKTTNTTMFIAVPQILHMMHSKIMKKIEALPTLVRLYIELISRLGLSRIFLRKFKNAFGKRLRFFVSGGAKLDANVAKDFFRFGIKVLEGYGLTETSPVASFNPLKKQKIGSIGKPVPDVKINIVNKDVDDVGEITIQGPNVMKGYYQDEEKTKKVIKDDWFYSGDLGYMDKEGYIYITGRSKEVIVLTSGKNIYPEEVERHYSTTPYVKEMCVMGVLKKKGRGNIEYLHAVVVPDFEFFKERGEINLRKVLKNSFEVLSKDMANYKHIVGFTVTKENLPRTLLGKIKRYEVEKKFLPIILDEDKKEKDISFEEKELLESDTAKELLSCVKDSLEITSPVHLSDSIELDLGVDSLGRVELLCAIEKHFNIDLPEEMVAGEIFTVKDLLSKIEDALKEGSSKKDTKAISWPDILKEPLSDEFKKKILLRPRLFDYILTVLVKGSIDIFFRIFYKLKVEGSSKIPKKGPYVLCVNHTSFLDGFIVSAGVPFKIQLQLFFIAFRRYFIFPIIRNLVKRSRIIPIDATEIVEAMKATCFILKHNRVCCIFPEGERSIDGKLKEFKKGIGIISKELNVPLVPTCIEGAYEAWPRTQRFPKLHPIKIRFGDPVSSEELIQKGLLLGAKDEYEAIAIALRGEFKNFSLA